jgi:hypothetical protein
VGKGLYNASLESIENVLDSQRQSIATYGFAAVVGVTTANATP